MREPRSCSARGGGYATLVAHAERLLRRAPRWLEVVCAAPLVAIALTLFYGVAVYLRYQQYYGRNLGEKAIDWIYVGIEALIGAAVLGLAINLVRGASRRPEGGLFSPNALRTWGVAFALFPLGLMLASWKLILHPHFFLFSWIAAAACFMLAARRQSAPAPEDRPRPIE